LVVSVPNQASALHLHYLLRGSIYSGYPFFFDSILIMKQVLLIGVAFLLAACGAPNLATPPPTPEAISVTYVADLKPWADKLSACASGNPLVSLYFTQAPATIDNIFADEVMLDLGEPVNIEPSSHLFQIGWEQITLVVNQGNNISKLTNNELQRIFVGQTLRWADDSSKVIQVWVLPEYDPARIIFDRTVMPSLPLASEAMLAPDPQAMLEAISADANAIGYLPLSVISSGDPILVGKLKTIQIDSSLEQGLRQPVIAITHAEPQGLLRELLVCLQTRVP